MMLECDAKRLLASVGVAVPPGVLWRKGEAAEKVKVAAYPVAVKRIRMEARMFNLQGDTTFINGKVVKKYVQDRCALLDIEMTGINQRGELTSPGFATVMLPARGVTTRIPIDGTVVDLDLPPIR